MYFLQFSAIQLLYNSIKTVRRNRQKPKERRLVANFDKRLQEGLTNLEKRLQRKLSRFVSSINTCFPKSLNGTSYSMQCIFQVIVNSSSC